MKQVAIYARISSDVAGEGLGVARQIEDCTALARQRGWEVAETLTDNDLSAFSGKARPGYARLLAAVEGGSVTGIVVWHPDRLHRSPLELEAFISLVERTGTWVESVQAGDLDLSTPSGRMIARTVGAFARYESEHKSSRIRRKLEQNAAAGKHHGGKRPFGWDEDRRALRADEADTVRLAVRLCIAGQSMKSVVRRLNAEDRTTSTGRPWTDVGVRDMLNRPRNAGLRVHHGEVVGTGTWEPIITTEEHEAVARLLHAPGRVTTPGLRARTHLLSGLARCGVCDGPLRVAQSKPYVRKRDGVRVSEPIYRCRQAHVTRNQARLDHLVTGYICARLDMPDAAALLEPRHDDRPGLARAEGDRLRLRLQEAAEDYAADLLTREQLRSVTADLRERIAAADAAAEPAAPPVGALAELVHGSAAEVWERLDVKQRRSVVDLLLAVRLLPTQKGQGFVPADVEVFWK